MTDEQNERAARVWREACGAYEDNSHDPAITDCTCLSSISKGASHDH